MSEKAVKRIISAAIVCLFLAAAVTAAVYEKGRTGQAAQTGGFTYILTYVDIAGRVNNGDPGAKNGRYTVK